MKESKFEEAKKILEEALDTAAKVIKEAKEESNAVYERAKRALAELNRPLTNQEIQERDEEGL